MAGPMAVCCALGEQFGAHGLVRNRQTFEINLKIHGTSAIQAASRDGERVAIAAGGPSGKCGACLAKNRRCAEIEPTARRTEVASFQSKASFLVANARIIFHQFLSRLYFIPSGKGVSIGDTRAVLLARGCALWGKHLWRAKKVLLVRARRWETSRGARKVH